MVDALAVMSCFVLSLLSATVLVRKGIPALKASQYGAQSQGGGGESGPSEILPESGRKRTLFDWTSNGLWIGVCETVLVFVFVFESQYGALAIIMAAKEFVRREKIEKNPAYYLLGTLINLATAILFALLARSLAGRLG